jgi:putative ABC transport system permease protein
MGDTLELFTLAFRNVRRRKRRTILTMLGVFIGIAAVVALVSLGQGLQGMINAQFEKIGGDKIIIQAREMGFGGQNIPNQLKQRELDISEKTKGVKRAAGALFRAQLIVFNDFQRTQFVMGMPDNQEDADLLTQVNSWEIEEGRMLTSKDKGKAVIGNDLAHKDLFKKTIQIGNKILVGGKLFEVVGILKRTGDPGTDPTVTISEEELRELTNESDAYSYIVAQSASGENPEEVADDVKKAIRRDRHQKEGKEDFSVQTSTQMIESFTKIFNIIQAVFIGIAAISLVVGGIGIMNTMFTAVLERTREIGVMKSIGARNRDILGMFLIESGLLGTAGGVIGIIIGFMISKGVEVGVNYQFGAGTLMAAFPWYLIVGALAFSFGVGAISGLMPARRASRLKPVDALRYE